MDTSHSLESLRHSLPRPDGRRDQNPQCSFERRARGLRTDLISPVFLLRFRRLQIMGGWFFTTMALAGMTGFVRRE
jgi:hypothetical protein